MRGASAALIGVVCGGLPKPVRTNTLAGEVAGAKWRTRSTNVPEYRSQELTRKTRVVRMLPNWEEVLCLISAMCIEQSGALRSEVPRHTTARR